MNRDEMDRAAAEANIFVVRAGRLSTATEQTPGMPRAAAISGPTTKAKRLWMGRVSTPEGAASGLHHHGEAETGGYILAGRPRVHFGPGLERHVDLEPGDFIYVGPFVPHAETNLSDSEPVEFVTARTPDNIVVNLEGDPRG